MISEQPGDQVSRPLSGRRILVAHPSAELYGSDRVLVESVIGMVDGGAEVVVTVPGTGPLIAVLKDAGAQVVVAPAFVLRKSMLHPTTWASSAALLFRAIRAARAGLTRTAPDAVYINTVTQPVWAIMARLARRKVLVHVHEAEDRVSLPYRVVLSIPARIADSVVFNSEASRSIFARSARSAASRGVIIYNGVAGPKHATEPREQLENRVRLLYFGRLSPRKGPDVAVEALALLRATGIDAHLDLLGDVFAGYEWFAEALDHRINELGLRPHVRQLGFDNEIWPTVAACDIALVPSRFTEPFGNTAVEAVLAKRPVIVSDAGGLREAVDGVASALIAPAGDAAELARAAQLIIDNWSRFRTAAIDAAPIASARFSPLRYRQEIVDLVAALISR